MASSPGPEKEWRANDPVVGANTTTQDEPVANEIPTPTERDVEKSSISDLEKDPAQSQIARQTSPSSEATDPKAEPDSKSKGKLPWRKRINPWRNNPPPVPKSRLVSREYTAGFFSRLIFQWMSPIMTVGYARPLELNDLWLVNPDRSAELLAVKLKSSFKTRHARGDKRPLLGALYDTLKVEFLVGGACQFTQTIIQVISPFLLRFLIAFAQEAWYAQHANRPGPPLSHGLGIVFAILVLQIIQSVCGNHFLYRGMMVGGQCRAVLMTVIFDKAVRLSGRAKAGGKAMDKAPEGVKPGSEEEKKWYKKMLKKRLKGNVPDKLKEISGDGRGWSNGRIINLMSTDTYRIDQASGFFHMLWCSPISITITLVLLIVNLSYSALAGFGLLVIAMPILARAIRTLFVRRVAINKITDQRVTLTQEILQAVRFVKFFGWETAFLNRIYSIRKREIFSIQKLLATRNAINAISMSMPIFASMLAFITYSLTNHGLDPARIFSSLALFNGLRMPLNFLPLVLGQVIDALSSVKRIQDFLLEEEAGEEVVWDYNNKNAIIMDHASFTWERTTSHAPEGIQPMNPRALKAMQKAAKKAEKAEKKGGKPAVTAEKKTGDETGDTASEEADREPFKLLDMDITVGRNELIAVIGTVGCGKSSLLAALAGDMRKTDGTVTLGARRAFCPQYAWIQNATVRDNVVFGQKFDQDWYDEVVDACALRPDLEMLPSGDMTEIGERGITVSGGQKQRLNIARAIYFDADIVLMDDPLSAVDAHVGRHIMDYAICGLLKNKCRILATHQLHVLNRCDRILWLEDGKTEAIDTFDNLMENNEGFRDLMATTAVEEKKEATEETNDDEIEEKKKNTTLGTKKGAALMTAEDRAVAAVDWSVYKAYLRAAGGMWVAPLVLGLLLLTQAANIATSLWLSFWTSNKFHFKMGIYIGVYAALGVAQAVLMFLFSVSLSIFGTQASKHMLHDSIYQVLRAPMSFFDTTPLGRISNRFSKDIDTMDNNLTDAMRMYFMTLAMITSVFILIIVYFHFFGVALGPLFIMFCFSASFYRSSAREIKRHEAVQRSFVFGKFAEAIVGTPTIRAYGLQDRFSKAVRDSIDNMNSCYFLTFANQRWLSIRLDVIGNLLVFTVGILVVTSRFTINPSIGGLVLSYILSIVQMIQFTVRQLAEVENNMNATERIHYYIKNLEEEAPLTGLEVPKSWPEKGEIEFENVEMRYRPGLPTVLRGINLHVKAGERIGVVGRTGAGKSSIMSTLFRMIELCGGSIKIDGVDISKVGLADLRSRLAIIPQDPTLFRGTIRSNLDPFDEHSDLELWSALGQADLVGQEAVMEDKTQRIHLDTVVEEEGLNFSLGQRQLMALARALVRGAQIIVCDEATSSVDMETDQKIQATIASGFKGKTLLCIAHRLKTIISYDRIMVMEGGRIAELGTPTDLYEANGIFRGMCERSGIKREEFYE